MATEIKYHINPKTGRTGLCRASIQTCQFGAHYGTKEEAEKARAEKANDTAVPSGLKKYGSLKKKDAEKLLTERRILMHERKALAQTQENIQSQIDNMNALATKTGRKIEIPPVFTELMNENDEKIKKNAEELGEFDKKHGKALKDYRKKEIADEKRTKEALEAAKRAENASCSSKLHSVGFKSSC